MATIPSRDSAYIQQAVDELTGSAGIATFPAAAIPADGVSVAEVVRQLYAALEGTAASQNGVATWPTAAAYANNVSIAEVLAYIQDGTRRGTGTSLAANESLADMLYAANGIATFPAAAVPANGVSLAEVIRYICDTQFGAALASQPRFVAKQHTSALTTGNIFTFTGTIEIMAIWGRVTTVIQAQATTIKISVVNDALTAYDLGTTVDGNAAAVGTLLSVPAAAASAHVLTANGVLNPTQDARIITTCTTSGAIKATYGAASTGAILYQMLWRPLSSDASVAAA